MNSDDDSADMCEILRREHEWKIHTARHLEVMLPWYREDTASVDIIIDQLGKLTHAQVEELCLTIVVEMPFLGSNRIGFIGSIMSKLRSIYQRSFHHKSHRRAYSFIKK
jgi:hypothetical protein